MHKIVIIIIVISVICEIFSWLFSRLRDIFSWLWDNGIITILIVLVACGAIAYGIFWLYTRAGCPNWPIWAFAVFMIAFDILCLPRYLCLKIRYGKILEKSLIKAEQIQTKTDELTAGLKNKILDGINGMGMATDAEIFKEISFDSFDKLDEEKRDLVFGLKKIEQGLFGTEYVKIAEISNARKKVDRRSLFLKQLKALVDQKKIEIKTELNGEVRETESWDNTLYYSINPCPKPSNMLEPIHLNMD